MTVAADLAAASTRRPAPAAAGWPDLLSHREHLLRFARRRLHDPVLAEDVVQDVFEAVLSGRAAFAGRSALRTWLTGVLKHKIVDLVRQRANLDSLDDDGEGDAGSGSGAGRAARAAVCPRPRPDEVAEQRQTLQRLLARIDALPAGLRDVVDLRLLQDRSTDDVCAALAISQENLFVRLHRARRQLLS